MPNQIEGSPNTYWFEKSTSDSVVLIGHEEYFGGNIIEYVEALDANVSFGVLEDESVKIDAEGMRSYLLTYSLNDAGNTYRIDVKVWSTEPANYWRSVGISPLDDNKAHTDARAMAQILENTVHQ